MPGGAFCTPPGPPSSWHGGWGPHSSLGSSSQRCALGHSPHKQATEPMHGGNEGPQKETSGLAWGEGGHTSGVGGVQTAKLDHLGGSSTGRQTAILCLPWGAHTHIHTCVHGSREQTHSHEGVRTARQGRELPERWISQALNHLMSWGLINSGSCDCSWCPPEGSPLRDNPGFPGDIQGAPGYGLGWRDHILGARCLEHGTSVNLSR